MTAMVLHQFYAISLPTLINSLASIFIYSNFHWHLVGYFFAWWLFVMFLFSSWVMWNKYQSLSLALEIAFFQPLQQVRIWNRDLVKNWQPCRVWTLLLSCHRATKNCVCFNNPRINLFVPPSSLVNITPNETMLVRCHRLAQKRTITLHRISAARCGFYSRCKNPAGSGRTYNIRRLLIVLKWMDITQSFAVTLGKQRELKGTNRPAQ